MGGGSAEQGWERMNTHETMCITVECMGHTLRLSQDPNTEHLGTTVWDASIVAAKMFEKNIRKGEFSRTKLGGKRAIELGAGMGLGGIALALLGMDTTLTDTLEVLPLLKRNCEFNLGVGKVLVQELDWLQPQQVANLSPPYDLLLATDCIYHEHIVPHFHSMVMALSTPKSTVLVVNELRSQSVHAAFMAAFTPTHTIKRMPASKLDDKYQHPLIEVYVLKKKKEVAGGQDTTRTLDEDATEAEAGISQGIQLAAGSETPAETTDISGRQLAAAASGKTAAAEGVGQPAGSEGQDVGGVPDLSCLALDNKNKGKRADEG